MLSWPLLILAALLLVPPPSTIAQKKSDYLQPYKFVKPLADLGDLYRQAEETEEETHDRAAEKKGQSEAVAGGPAAEDRTGLASPVPEKPLMTSGLAPPPEPLPQPTALKDSRGRSRKKPEEAEALDRVGGEPEEEEVDPAAAKEQTKERKTTKEKKEKKESDSARKSETKIMKKEGSADNMSNHNTELEGRALPPHRPNAIKYRVPPKPEDEYYYYYDEYYEDYPDYLPYPGRPSSDNRKPPQPKIAEKYPNFPSKPQEKKKPPPAASAAPPEKAPKEKPRKAVGGGGSGGSKPPKDLPANVPWKSEKGDRREGNEPDINSTLKRLKNLRKKQESLPPGGPLPNPWDKFNAPPKNRPEQGNR
jgi:hypothetical protein